MSEQVYISADYDYYNGDQDVVEELVKWGKDDKHKVDFVDMSNPSSDSISDSNDCRICDLKREFNSQINASSTVVFVVGDRTKYRTAGSNCDRNNKEWYECYCTPYKQNMERNCVNGLPHHRHQMEMLETLTYILILDMNLNKLR